MARAHGFYARLVRHQTTRTTGHSSTFVRSGTGAGSRRMTAAAAASPAASPSK